MSVKSPEGRCHGTFMASVVFRRLITWHLHGRRHGYHMSCKAISAHGAMVVAFCSHAKISEDRSKDHSPPALLFKVKIYSHTAIPLTADSRISPQWLSELRRLWAGIP